MSKEHIIYRTINGTYCRCRDVGCDDLDRAEYNRFIVSHGLFTTFYEQMERWFAHTPLGAPLPPWMPLGALLQVDRKDWRQNGGGREGKKEDAIDEVVET